MLLQFAGELCVIAQSADANKPEHVAARLELVTFLATELGPASSKIRADVPRNQQFKTSLDLMLQPHRAEMAARQRIDDAIGAALANVDGVVDRYTDVVEAIGGAPLSAAAKNACFARMDLRFQALVASAEPKSEAQLRFKYQYRDTLRGIHDHVLSSWKWPDPKAYQALTDAKLNFAQQEALMALAERQPGTTSQA
jgi:hypothetical protein